MCFFFAVRLSLAQRAFPGGFRKLFDEFLTQMLSGEHTICLSVKSQCTTFQIKPTTLAVPTACNSDIFKQLLEA